MLKEFSLFDFKYYFKRNKKIYFFFLFFFFIGIFVGLMIAISSDSYLSLLSSKDKLFYDYVNGKVDFSKEVLKLIFNFFIFQLVIFLLNLNFYTGLFSYVLVSYQSALMILSMIAVVSQLGFSGIFRILFFVLPVNLVLMICACLFSGFCLVRSYDAKQNKRFSYGFDEKEFWLVILFFVVFGILFSYLINLVLVIFLRRRFFIMY